MNPDGIVSAFQASCAAYSVEKKQIMQLEEKYPDLCRMVSMDEKGIITVSTDADALQNVSDMSLHLYVFLITDVFYVDRAFQKLEEKYGSTIRNMLFSYYTERLSMAEAAEKEHMTRRQLQYGLKEWLPVLLEGYHG